MSAVRHGGDARLLDDARDRRAHEDRLVEERRDLELLGERGESSAAVSRMRLTTSRVLALPASGST